MLSKKDIEELATGAVKRYFNTCNLVSPQIQENDKTPDWDGELNLYENKKDIRKKLYWKSSNSGERKRSS